MTNKSTFIFQSVLFLFFGNLYRTRPIFRNVDGCRFRNTLYLCHSDQYFNPSNQTSLERLRVLSSCRKLTYKNLLRRNQFVSKVFDILWWSPCHLIDLHNVFSLLPSILHFVRTQPTTPMPDRRSYQILQTTERSFGPACCRTATALLEIPAIAPSRPSWTASLVLQTFRIVLCK